MIAVIRTDSKKEGFSKHIVYGVPLYIITIKFKQIYSKSQIKKLKKKIIKYNIIGIITENDIIKAHLIKQGLFFPNIEIFLKTKLLSSVQMMLSTTRHIDENKTVLICDNSICVVTTELVKLVLQNFRNIVILTTKTEAYETLANDIFKNFGVSILVTDTLFCSVKNPDLTIIVNGFDSFINLIFSKKTIIACCDEKALKNSRNFFVLIDDISTEIPDVLTNLQAVKFFSLLNSIKPSINRNIEFFCCLSNKSTQNEMSKYIQNSQISSFY